jgi:hypothetical protein
MLRTRANLSRFIGELASVENRIFLDELALCFCSETMYCPNCGVENRIEHNYCRSCGLRLDAITQVVSDQFPTKEFASLERRKALFEKLGLFSLSLAGFLAFALIFTRAAYYKIILFGEDVIFGSAFVALVLFGLLSVFFFNYPKLFMKFEKVNPRLPASKEPQAEGSPSERLLEDRPFQPVPSVTESSTELLPLTNKTRKLG